MDDATLDQFGDDTEGETDPAEPARADEASDAADAETAATFAWTPGGAPCAACGAVVERRWRRERGLVCPACVGWE